MKTIRSCCVCGHLNITHIFSDKGYGCKKCKCKTFLNRKMYTKKEATKLKEKLDYTKL